MILLIYRLGQFIVKLFVVRALTASHGDDRHGITTLNMIGTRTRHMYEVMGVSHDENASKDLVGFG